MDKKTTKLAVLQLNKDVSLRFIAVKPSEFSTGDVKFFKKNEEKECWLIRLSDPRMAKPHYTSWPNSKWTALFHRYLMDNWSKLPDFVTVTMSELLAWAEKLQ